MTQALNFKIQGALNEDSDSSDGEENTIKDNSLIVATQGRSIWMLDDLTVIHQLSSSIDEEKLYKPKDSYRMRGAGGRKSLTAGTNLPNGVIIHYFLPNYNDQSDEVNLWWG